MSTQQSQAISGPVTALVEYQVRAESCTPTQWLEVWGARGGDALEGEPETTAYEAAVATEDAHRVLIFERYANGESSIEAHRQRTAHAALTETMGDPNMTKRRAMSHLLADVEGYGWWGRPEQCAIQATAGLELTLIGMRFTSDAMREEYLAVTGEHAAYCQQNEPGTLIYSGGLALRDGDRGPDIKAGDLLFVAVFTDEAATIQHRDDPRHIALQPELQAIGRERTFLQTYRTSGKGFLWCQRYTHVKDVRQRKQR